MFSRSSCSMMLSTMSLEVTLYLKYIWRPPKPEVTLSQHIGLVDHHIYFRYNATSGDIVDNTIEQLDLENMGIAVEILFLAVLCVEIVLLLVWAAAISISGITRLPVTSSTTSLNSWTSKIWVWPLGFCPYVSWNSR